MKRKAYIKTVSPEAAHGRVKKIYDAARDRAGKVFNIVCVQSLLPEILEGGLMLYVRCMLSPGPLPRHLREMIAVVVSKTNNCEY